MSAVCFVVTTDFDAQPSAVWDELVDWKGHEAWIPATRVEIEGDDPTAVGTRFTAWTGYGPLALEDRMEVAMCDWSDADDRGECEVTKMGPVLEGLAGFTVFRHGAGARVEWVEDVRIRWLPGVLAPIAARLGAAGFKFGMRRLRHIVEGRG